MKILTKRKEILSSFKELKLKQTSKYFRFILRLGSQVV